MSNLAKAISIASEAHMGQFDKGGVSYIMHPLHVMMTVEHLGEEVMIVAILHDAIEDSKLTLNDLKQFGFSEKILISIYLLTHAPIQNYNTYIKAIKRNNIATMVKIADLEHNMQVKRIKYRDKLSIADDIITASDEKILKRMKKYLRAWTYLKEE